MTDQDEQVVEAGATTRRALLAGGGAVCLALLLGACGSDDATTTTASDGDDDSGEAWPTEDAGTGGQELAKVADVPSGGGKLFGSVLLVKLADGTIKAYDAHCRHVPTNLVDAPTDGKIVCPFHGSTYKLDDGSVLKGPANQGLKTIDVKVQGDAIVRA